MGNITPNISLKKYQITISICYGKAGCNMNLNLLDKYILRLIEKNGWYVGRQFRDSDYWITEIEKYGYQPFEHARQIICELGGLFFHEYSPVTYQKMIELKQKDGREIPKNFAADIKVSCESCLEILRELHMENRAEEYSGATFAFDALSAAIDDEIILDIEIIKGVVGEVLFPIGTVAPDGISFVGKEGKIYTAFNDSIYLSGENIEFYLNMMFTELLKPIRLYQI